MLHTKTTLPTYIYLVLSSPSNTAISSSWHKLCSISVKCKISWYSIKEDYSASPEKIWVYYTIGYLIKYLYVGKEIDAAIMVHKKRSWASISVPRLTVNTVLLPEGIPEFSFWTWPYITKLYITEDLWENCVSQTSQIYWKAWLTENKLKDRLFELQSILNAVTSSPDIF